MPLFVSHRTLSPRKRLPRARAPWALDSGAFTELSTHGRWTVSADEYVEAVAQYEDQVGHLEWAAPMDWMCEPFMLGKTGLTVREHQHRTVTNYLQLRDRGPFIPVLQGWTLDDYEACIDLYADAGIDLRTLPLVGVGSVCRRQDTMEIGRIFQALSEAEISCHGFGVKKKGLALYGRFLASADSMAWSYEARRNWPLADCRHRSCANCPHYALRWRADLLAHTHQLGLGMAA